MTSYGSPRERKLDWALRTTVPRSPCARQQQQLGCCDNAGSQRLLWLQRLDGCVETPVGNVLAAGRRSGYTFAPDAELSPINSTLIGGCPAPKA
ncbi:hypothetical protein GOODEAATRI_025171 [Goodea atripinnis]|uniref:Uncharacterized protein n=1 Tax=Goodea atripinnis TaxID=208336 RepID=A0ABV0Q1C3_9TELE